jgi:hypothetical protein
MVAMNAQPAVQPRRVVLLPAGRERRAQANVRRYRLGRLGSGPPPGTGGERFAYLKRGHDEGTRRRSPARRNAQGAPVRAGGGEARSGRATLTGMQDAAGPSLARRAIAIVILAVAAYLILKVVLHVIVGLVASVLWAVIAVAAIVGLVWALRNL